MPNFQRWSRSPGLLQYRETVPPYSQDFDTDSRQFVYQGNSVRGRPSQLKPMPSNAYELNVQDFTCEVGWFYTYPSIPGRRVWNVGPALNRGATTGFSWTTADAKISASWDRLYNDALDRFVDSYRGGLDVSVDLAESKQTLKMLKVTDQVKDITTTFFKKHERFGVLRAPAKAWLTYTYGIRPLLGTIHGLAEEAIRVKINKVNRYKGRASEKIIPGSVNLNLYNGWHTNLNTDGEGKTSVTIGGYIASPEFDPGRLTSLNPLSITWELLPYSFVADWFYDLGGYLRGMETALLYDSQWRGGYVTKLWAFDGLLAHAYHGSNSYSEFDISYRGRIRNIFIQRQVLGAFPRPNLPTFGANLGSSRLLSAASLLASMLGGRKR